MMNFSNTPIIHIKKINNVHTAAHEATLYIKTVKANGNMSLSII